jgi:hypothetical protein
MKNLTSFFFAFLFVHIIDAQQNTVGLISYDFTQSSVGYNLHYPHNQGNVYLLNACGEIVHRWDDPVYKPGNGIQLKENGLLYVTKGKNALSNSFIHAGGGGEKVEIRNWNNQLLWEKVINDSTQRMHHDIEVLPNGNVLAIVWEYKNDAEAIAAGRNPAKLTGNGALGNGLWPEKIVELQPDTLTGTTQIVWEWHAWDHLIQDFDNSKDNYGVVENYPGRIDMNYTYYDSTADWMHANAIDYNPQLDQIMLCVPTFNEVWIIDHSTTTAEAAGHTGGLVGKGGDLIYRFGNPAAYRGNGPTTLFYPHDAHWVDLALSSGHPEFGKVTVFNNKVGPDYSSVHTFSPVFDTYTWQYNLLPNGDWSPSNFDWTYTANPPQSFYSTGLGAIQILPNGNRLINEGREGRAFELNGSGEIVWEYINPMKMGNPVAQYDTTITPSSNQQFRFSRYPLTYSAFTNKILEPQGYIELNPDTTFCLAEANITELAAVSDAYFISPNPANNQLEIKCLNSINTIQTVDLIESSGKKLIALVANEKEVTLNISEFVPGVYYVLINGYSRAKIIKY